MFIYVRMHALTYLYVHVYVLTSTCVLHRRMYECTYTHTHTQPQQRATVLKSIGQDDQVPATSSYCVQTVQVPI